MKTLEVVNWARFQHYRDRNPPWIKLHTSLLDDYDFQKLPRDAKWQLLLLWLLAARQDNRIPDDPEWLADLFHVDSGELEIDLLVDRGWLARRIAVDDSTLIASPDSTNGKHKPPPLDARLSTKAVESETETDKAQAPEQTEPCPRF